MTPEEAAKAASSGMTAEQLADILMADMTDRAGVIISFLEATNDLRLSEKEMMYVEVGIMAGLTATLELLAEKGWLKYT